MRGPGVVISVWNLRAAVCRRVDWSDGSWTYEPAANWEALEEEAIDAVEAQGGAINWSGLYECPWELAEKATWPEE